MAKMFLFAGLKDKNKLYEVTSKGLIEIKDNNKIDTRGAICLIYEKPISNSHVIANFINVGVHDIILSDVEIHRENHVKFGSATVNKIFPLKVNNIVYKLSISLKRDVFNDLFYKYEFSKIIPLSVFLWKNGKGVHGIVSKEVSFFKIVDKNYLDCKNINELANVIYSEEFSGELDKDNLIVLNNIYESNNVEDTINDNKPNFNIYLLEKIDRDYFEDLNSKEYNFSDFKREIDKTPYFIEDTVSAYYFSKLYKPFIILFILIFGGVTGTFFSLNTKNIAQNYFLGNEIQTKNQIVTKQTNVIKELKKENYYPYIVEPEIKETTLEIHKKLQEIVKFNEVEDLKITIIAPGKAKFNFFVSSYEKFEELDLMFKNNKNINVKNEKSNNKYSFEIIYNINNEAKDSKDSFKNDKKINKKR